MSLSRHQLRKQITDDRAYFDALRANVKNALVRELSSFWPKAKDAYPEKFVDVPRPTPTGDTVEADGT